MFINIIKVKLARKSSKKDTGIRILVDNYPRGILRKDLGIHYWFKELIPNYYQKEIYKFAIKNHDSWTKFKGLYFKLLCKNKGSLIRLKKLEKKKKKEIILLHTSAHLKKNNAFIIKDLLQKYTIPELKRLEAEAYHNKGELRKDMERRLIFAKQKTNSTQKIAPIKKTRRTSRINRII